MPELPEVETMVRGIRADCVGRRIERTLFPPCPCRPIQIWPDRRTLITETEGQTITDICRLAKRIVLKLRAADRGRTADDGIDADYRSSDAQTSPYLF